MQALTLLVAAIASVLALTARPAYALAAYVTVLLWYPSYLVVRIGTLDISAGRITIAALLCRSLCSKAIRSRFQWSRLDGVILVSMAVYVIVYFLPRPFGTSLENRLGFLMDTLLVYLAFRFLAINRKTVVTFVKCVAVVLVPLAVLGMIEAASNWRAFLPFWHLCPWYEGVPTFEQRWGLNRAIGPFNHPILFGCCFAMFLPLVYYLRHDKAWRTWAYILSGLTLVGALSSMSSGPWIMALTAVFCLALERYKHWTKPLLVCFVCSCLLAGVVSNRPFYHVLFSYADIVGGAGWHRAALIDAAIQHFREWWFLGYGMEDPGWGYMLGMGFTDVTNEFILAGVRYGILGIIALCATLIVGFLVIVRAYRRMIAPEAKMLCWALGTCLFSIMVTWISVSFFGQIVSLEYCVLGLLGSLPSIVLRELRQSRPELVLLRDSARACSRAVVRAPSR